MARELTGALLFFDVPWRWGVADCCTAACNAFFAFNGIDPMKELRGKYDCRKTAQSEIAARGGFIRMCEELASSSGLIPGCGASNEIGVVQTPYGLALSFCVAPKVWAVKSHRGFILQPDFERSWACRRQ